MGDHATRSWFGKGMAMTEGTDPRDFVRLLHELADGLQATGNYLDTARRFGCEDRAEQAPCSEMLDKAASQLRRVQASYRQLRAGLSDTPSRESFAEPWPFSI